MNTTIIKVFIFSVIVSLVFALAYREILIRKYPPNVRHYQKIMREICTEEYKEALLTEYPELETNMTIESLLSWLHGQMKYPETNLEKEILTNFRRTNINHEDPITIINFGLGRCGEFSIAFTAILYTQDYCDVRMVMDLSPDSSENDVKDGDHVWVEFYIFAWVHIDPTEARINDPLTYERDWKKILTEVWSVEPNYCERIEENYQWVNE